MRRSDRYLIQATVFLLMAWAMFLGFLGPMMLSSKNDAFCIGGMALLMVLLRLSWLIYKKMTRWLNESIKRKNMEG